MTILKLIALAAAATALLTTVATCKSDHSDKLKDWTGERLSMVENQIKGRGITDPGVLKAMTEVERHLFVPQDQRPSAYADHALPIGKGQTISQPYIVALMTELLNLDGSEKVLEIGTGSGYQAAVLGELAKAVYTIEIVKELAEHSTALLNELGYETITVRCGDGYAGWAEHAPFDAIIVTCAPPEIPRPLLEQLADSGRMVVPVGDFWQELVLIERVGDEYYETKVLPVRFVPMTGDGIKGQE